MAVFKRGNNWWIDYYVQGRRRRELIGPNKKLAEAVLGRRKVEIAEGKFLDVRRKSKVKFKDFAPEYLDYAKVNKRSWENDDKVRLNRLIPFFGNWCLHEIDTRTVEEFKKQRISETTRMGTTVRPATVNRELACLKHLFNVAIAWDKVRSNPVRGVKFFREGNKRTRFLTKRESRRLIEACDERLRPVVIVALHTGMRIGEIFKLKWEDIDFDQGIIYVLDTKSGKPREIPTNKVLTETLRHIKFKGVYVFCRDGGKRYAYSTIRKPFKTALARAGIEDLRFHDLRHSFASQLVMDGVDLKTVQELMGHKTIEMTLRYSHLSPDHKRQAFEKLESYLENDGHLYGHQLDLKRREIAVTH